MIRLVIDVSYEQLGDMPAATYKDGWAEMQVR